MAEVIGFLTRMQYIKKQNSFPTDWETWFTTATGQRSYDYGKDYSSLTHLSKAKAYLISEQNGLCAYCQCSISSENSSIEHVVPKSLNKEHSTNYFSLVAVCKPLVKDEKGEFYCDKAKRDSPITPLLFFSDSSVVSNSNNRYFEVGADGQIGATHHLNDSLKKQVDAFIEIVNLNHPVPKQNRTGILNGMIEIYRSLSPLQRNAFWRVQFNRIQSNRRHPYRQFLLIYIGRKLGIN